MTFTAAVGVVSPGAGTPTGTVTFRDGSTALGTGTLSNGKATFTTSTLSVGTHTLTATYSGDGHYGPSSGSLTGNPQVINKAGTVITETTSTNPSISGRSVTFTAIVKAQAPGAGSPTGTVTFYDGNTKLSTITLSGGKAAFAYSKLSVGTHTITVDYNGSTTFATSVISLSQVVNK